MRIWQRLSERYVLALVLLLISLVYTMAMPEGEWEGVGSIVLQSIALFATLAAAQADRRIMAGLAVILVLAPLLAIAQAAFGGGDGPEYVRLGSLVIVLLSLPLVAVGLFEQVRARGMVTLHTMTGVLVAYLLLMSAFAYGYSVIGELASEPFFAQGAEWDTLGDYLYFSVITITTVGFGDLSPAGDLGRSLSAAEALIGQIYVVTIVAAIVANVGRKRSDRGGPPDQAGGSEGTRR